MVSWSSASKSIPKKGIYKQVAKGKKWLEDRLRVFFFLGSMHIYAFYVIFPKKAAWSEISLSPLVLLLATKEPTREGQGGGPSPGVGPVTRPDAALL